MDILPLQEAKTLAYLQALLPPVEGLERHVAALHKALGGIPLLLEEQIRFLVVRRVLTEKHGHSVLGEFAAHILPADRRGVRAAPHGAPSEGQPGPRWSTPQWSAWSSTVHASIRYWASRPRPWRRRWSAVEAACIRKSGDSRWRFIWEALGRVLRRHAAG